MNAARSTITVGVDGTPASIDALVFALTEAQRRGGEVEVVTVWHFDDPFDGILAPQSPTEARARAEKVQDRSVAAALSRMQAPPVLSRKLVQGSAGSMLLAAAREADYLVVGSAHKGVAKRAVLGSVSHYIVQHAQVPVLVVPASTPQEPAADPAGEAMVPSDAGTGS